MQKLSHLTRLAIPVTVLLIFLIALQTGLGSFSASAQSGGGYDLTWNVIAGGGGTSTGGAYSLSGTIGQSDTDTLSGGAYTLHGGFWNDALNLARVFLPVIMR